MKRSNKLIGMILFLGGLIVTSSATAAAEHPDELYQKGRFEEAEKAYAAADMDHPKDTRFRYDRGCAAYQNSDFDGAVAAFSSVLKRTDNDETRFMATFNLGNAAFKKGDYQSAATYFKDALALKPDREDARANLELALRELKKEKESKKDAPKQKSPDDSKQNAPDQKHEDQKQGDQKQDDQKQGGRKEDGKQQKQEPTSDQKSSDSQNKSDKRDQQSNPQKKQNENPASNGGENKEHKQPQGSNSAQAQEAGQEKRKDFSGDLQPMKALPQQDSDEQQEQSGAQALDRRKADAFLDNVKENRSKFIQFQMGERRGRGVASGKDW